MITCKELTVNGKPYEFCETVCDRCGGRPAGCEFFEQETRNMIAKRALASGCTHLLFLELDEFSEIVGYRRFWELSTIPAKKPFEELAEDRWHEKAKECPARRRRDDLFLCTLLSSWGGMEFAPCTIERCTAHYWNGD